MKTLRIVTLYALLALSALAVEVPIWFKFTIINNAPTTHSFLQFELQNAWPGATDDDIPPTLTSGITKYYVVYYDFDLGETSVGFCIKVSKPTATLDGNSYIVTSGEEWVAVTESFQGNASNDSALTAVECGEVDVTVNRAPTSDIKKTGWVVADAASVAVTAGVFREGIDKMIQASSEQRAQATANAPNGAPLPTPDAITEGYTSQTAGQATAVSSIQDGIPGTPGGTAIMGNLLDDETKAGNEFTFGEFTFPTLAAIGVETVNFKPSLWWTDWATMADIIREIILLAIGVTWAVSQQRRYERYFIAWWNTPEKTTKPEPAQIAIPGVGWGKQISTALFMTAALVAVLSLAIVLINSHFDAISGSPTIASIFGMFTGGVNDIAGSALFGKAYQLINAFVPLVALFQYFTAHYLIGWTMPATWAGALWTAKHVHV